MGTLIRVRGDNYPVSVTFSVNDVPIDLTGSVLKFSYKNDDEVAKTITGSPTSDVGIAEFIPDVGDFLVEGTYNYDVQRVAGGYTYTHLKGLLIIEGDITP